MRASVRARACVCGPGGLAVPLNISFLLSSCSAVFVVALQTKLSFILLHFLPEMHPVIFIYLLGYFYHCRVLFGHLLLHVAATVLSEPFPPDLISFRHCEIFGIHVSFFLQGLTLQPFIDAFFYTFSSYRC